VKRLNTDSFKYGLELMRDRSYESQHEESDCQRLSMQKEMYVAGS
jgi:hypothetical protein